MMRIHCEIDVFSSLSERCPDVYALLKRCGELAGEEWDVYVVGGLVRDALLGLDSRDIDIVVTERAEAYARKLTDALSGQLTFHESFRTSSVRCGDTVLDVVQARRETYAYPGALPEVFCGTLEDDLRRRDFTANSLAAVLNPKHFGALAECGGYADLREGRLRIWHERSFIDDPTRIFRAVKYMVRCDWRLTPDTRAAALEAVASGALGTISAARLWRELKLILQERKAAACLRHLRDWGILAALDAPIDEESSVWSRLERAEALQSGSGDLRLSDCRRAQLMLGLLLSGCKEEKALLWLEKLSCSKTDKDAYKKSRQASALIPVLADAGLSMAERAFALKDADDVSLAVLTCFGLEAEAAEAVAAYAAQRRRMRPWADGRLLAQIGVPPGPVYGKLLREAWIAQFEGRIGSREEARRLIEVLLNA